MPALLETPPHPTDPDPGPAPREEHRVDPNDRGRALLSAIFRGEFPFSAVTPAQLPVGPRSAAEYDAISRAAGCRDLFIVHADPFAGEKFIAEVASATTERVLVLSPNPITADRIAERLLKCGVTVLRALAEDDNPVRPSPVVSKVTAHALGVGRIEQANRDAATALAATEKRMAAFAPVAKVIARLVEVNDALAKHDAVVAEHTARRDRCEAEVMDEAAGKHVTAFTALMDRRKTEHDAALAHVIELRVAARKAADEKDAEVNALRQQHAGATQKSGFFVRLFSKSKPTVDADEIARHLQTAESELAVLTATATARQTETEAQATAFAAERQKMIATEVASRRAACEGAVATAESERARARAEGAALNRAISAAVPNDNYADVERTLTAARERAAEVNRTAAEDIRRAVTEPRVVVGTPSSLGADPVFAALTETNDPPFGLLVLDRAEELPESAFPQLARHAGRWVLVGDALLPDPRGPFNGSRAPRGRPAEAPFVARVAKLLDRETWTFEDNRLVCRLAHLSPEQRRAVTREPLADRPEIELRFTAAADEPLPAEIAFPASMPVPEAKRFLFHTLNEVLLRPCGDLVWKHEPDVIIAAWPVADSDRDTVWIDLEPGVREKVVGSGLFAYTAVVRFDPAEGWDAEKAAAWLAKYLPPSTSSRFAALPRSR